MFLWRATSPPDLQPPCAVLAPATALRSAPPLCAARHWHASGPVALPDSTTGDRAAWRSPPPSSSPFLSRLRSSLPSVLAPDAASLHRLGHRRHLQGRRPRRRRRRRGPHRVRRVPAHARAPPTDGLRRRVDNAPLRAWPKGRPRSPPSAARRRAATPPSTPGLTPSVPRPCRGLAGTRAGCSTAA